MMQKQGKKVYAGLAVLILAGCLANLIDSKSQVVAQVESKQPSPILLAQAPLTKLTIAFASRSDTKDLQQKANQVAQLLSKELKIPVEAIVADETASVEALRANRVQVAFLAGRGALKAEDLAGARLYLAEVRPNYSGKYSYNSVFVVLKDSKLKSGAGKQTLEQLKGKTMAFTSPTSGSGFVFPVAELVKTGLVPNRDRLDGFFGRVTYGSGYGGALQAVLRGQADVAAVSEYSLAPPYITAEEAKRLRVLYSIPKVPAHGIVIDDSVPAAWREKIVKAFLTLNQPENNALLQSLYNSTSLVKVDHDSHLGSMKEALKRAGFQP